MALLNIRVVHAQTWRLRLWCNMFLSRASISLATVCGLPGIRFARFGVRCGRLCKIHGHTGLAEELMITPVSSVRYFEFAFTLCAFQPPLTGRFLDVSSPRLFSAYTLARSKCMELEIMNPDQRDLDNTHKLMESLPVEKHKVGFHCIYARDLPWADNSFDGIWCISVLEHIQEPEDLKALSEIWRVLKPGGIFVLSVPVKTRGHDEYRKEDVYGLHGISGGTGAGYFFQRYYDETSLRTRIRDRLPDGRVVAQQIWGEKEAGWFEKYESLWKTHGAGITCMDPFLMARNFRRYSAINELDGAAVACLAVRRNG